MIDLSQLDPPALIAIANDPAADPKVREAARILARDRIFETMAGIEDEAGYDVRASLRETLRQMANDPTKSYQDRRKYRRALLDQKKADREAEAYRHRRAAAPS